MTFFIPRDKIRNCSLILLLIASCFLLTGSGYLSWLYNLMETEANLILSNNVLLNGIITNVDILTEVIGYLFQVVGLFISVILINRGITKWKISILIVFDLILIILSMLMHDFASVLISGYCMNIMHGIISGYYLTFLFRIAPFNKIGILFGTGYAVGTIGTWGISIINGGEFLKSPEVIIIYTALTVISIIIINMIFSSNETLMETKNEVIDGLLGNKSIQKNTLTHIIISGIVVLTLSLVKGVGFYFPMSDISNGDFSLEFVRVFYAIGLIVAGIVNDFDYRWGRALCVAGLVFPFVIISLKQNQITSIYLWIISYAFAGFYTVYRVVAMARYGYYQSSNLKMSIPIIIFGMIFGRIGDSLGSLIGIALSDKTVILIVTGAIMYAASIFLVFAEIRVNITNILVTENAQIDANKIYDSDDIYLNLKKEYQISDREYEVLMLILNGYTNSKISSELFITENTVKFHVKNILKKMGCNNRKELSSIIKK